MTKVALYARYSSDSQNASSIEDQFRICREQAAREKWDVVATFHDAAISGASVILRPGIQALLQDAQAGKFDIVLTEALDRLSRDQADVATLYKHLKFADVTIMTLADGEISELHVGLKGTMNALFLKDLAAKTHRGMRGRVEKGKAGGGLCYGYDVVKRFDGNGEPIRGERTINEAQAVIIRRIYKEFASGKSPRSIATDLNHEGIPGPFGKAWGDTTIRGHVTRRTGLLHNELYIGMMIWNRHRYLKNPSTGKRVARVNPESEWIRTEVPDLRIIDDALWQVVLSRHNHLGEQYAAVISGVRKAHATNKLNGMHRAKSLFSGLVFCGCCGGPYSLRGQDRFACSTHVSNGSCSNSRTISRPALEKRVLAGLKDRLMAPDAAAEAMRAFAEETNRLNHERRASGNAWRTELAKIKRSLKHMLTIIEDGGYTRGMTDRMRELEAREDVLNDQLSQEPADTPDIHPNISEIYRHKVERLAEVLNQPENRAEAAEAIRGLIEKITLSPGPQRGQIDATLQGDLATILEWTAQKTNTPGTKFSGVSVSVDAGARFELTTFRL